MSIDYGNGRTNIDLKTGIRFGVISQHSILQAWADSSEGYYGDPQDPDCDGVEALSYSFKGDGYSMVNCLDSDVMVLKSPFFTYAPFCSPCVPGAGNLDSAADNARVTSLEYEADLHRIAQDIGTQCGVKTYAVGHDWFEDGVAPYPLYGVVSGRPCFPDSWYGNGIGPWTVIDGDRCQRGHWHLLSDAQAYLFAPHDGINMAGAFVRRI